MNRLLTIGLVASIALTGLCAADTYYVNAATGNDEWDGLCEQWDGGTCGPKATIQAGILVTGFGETLLVADGLYTGAGNRGIEFHGRNVKVRGANGPANCIIDCEGVGRAFYIHSYDLEYAAVEDLTIRNAAGDGIYIGTDSKPTIRGCVIESCGESGIQVAQWCLPVIVDCLFTGNGAGGISCHDTSSLVIRNCTFTGNTATQGGGIRATSCDDLSIIDCTFIANVGQPGGGGALYLANSSVTVEACALLSNYAQGIPAGSGRGGGLLVHDSDVTLVDCLLARNIAVNNGGGAYIDNLGEEDHSITLVNCTLSANAAMFSGGAVEIAGLAGDQIYLRDSILWANTSVLGAELALHSELAGWISSCDMPNSAEAIQLDPNAVLLWGLGNIESDPLFVDADADDFRLSPGSPCIDAGNNLCVMSVTDLDGNPRRVDDPDTPDTGFGAPPLVDLGAYEYQPLPPPMPGDLNCDGVVDFGDVNPFILALIDPAAYDTRHPDCMRELGDINDDGEVDFGDINPFVALLAG